jgi:hypothetical protein
VSTKPLNNAVAVQRPGQQPVALHKVGLVLGELVDPQNEAGRIAHTFRKVGDRGRRSVGREVTHGSNGIE